MAGIESTEVVVTKQKKTSKYPSRKSKKVQQKENTSYLYSNVTSVNESQDIEIITDCEWYLEGCPTWISVNPTNGNGNTTVHIEIENKEDGNGDIMFSNINNKLLVIKAEEFKLNHYVFKLNIPDGATIEWNGNGNIYEVDSYKDEYSVSYKVTKDGYNLQEGVLSTTSDKLEVEKTIVLHKKTNLFTFKIETDENNVIMWDNGVQHNMISVNSEESSVTVSYMVSRDRYGCKDDILTANIDNPNIQIKVELEPYDRNFYYGLYTEPQNCIVTWSNGKTGKNTRLTSKNNVQSIRYTASTEGYYDEVGRITASEPNSTVFGHINLRKK